MGFRVEGVGSLGFRASRGRAWAHDFSGFLGATLAQRSHASHVSGFPGCAALRWRRRGG